MLKYRHQNEGREHSSRLLTVLQGSLCACLVSNMTLIVSELSSHGIVMVGDSAVTYSDSQNRIRAKAGAAKIHYANAANMGFGVWGNALICNQQIDQWLSEFIHNNVSENSLLEYVGYQLAENLRYGFSFDGRSWGQLKCGIDFAGFCSALPRLCHIHM